MITADSFFDILKENNISQAQFARAVGYTPGALKKWKENDKLPKWAPIVLQHMILLKNASLLKRSAFK